MNGKHDSKMHLVLDSLRSIGSSLGMQITKRLVAAAALFLSGCFYNPTIDEEIADKCHISVAEWQRLEAALSAGRVGVSLVAGRCRLTHAKNGSIVGTLLDGSSWR